MKDAEIRQLIENYYDIQKIRVETFNRIVCWVKENKDRVMSCLSQNRIETREGDASQTKIESRTSNASRRISETQTSCALNLLKNKKYSEFVKKFVLSHIELEAHTDDASQVRDETRTCNASQRTSETRPINASHGKVEPQDVNASHNKIEAHEANASRNDYESHRKGASHNEIETHSSYAFSDLIKEIEDLIWFHNKLYETEKELYRRIDCWSRDHPLRKEFLNKVKGIGPILSSGIIAWLCNPILKADYVTQIWSFCGLAPNQERKRGERLNYNPRLKTFCWKIGQSFVKFKCFGRKLYEAFREDCERKHPDWSKLHCHNWARRKVVKLFIAAVWEVWRRMNKLPVTEPYPIEHLGHKDKIVSEKWVERKGG